MSKNGRTVIIGLDGVPFGMIKEFAESGVMPEMAKLVEGSVFKKMYSSVPEISSVAWSSMITGKNPAEHGIFGFMDLREGSYRMRFPNYSELKAPAFWDEWEGDSVIVNVPSTYPVRPMRGAHVSGFVSIDFAKSVYPEALQEELMGLNYRLDVDSQLAHKSMMMFLGDLDETLDARIKGYRYLWDSRDWQTFMLVFTGTDRLMHFLWEAYEDKEHRYHKKFLDHFRKIDVAIGEIAAKLGDDDLLIMHSDHGFERLDREVYVSYLLEENGFLTFKQDTDPAMENICFGTRAFVLDPGRIYLNLKGKYPCGSVEAGEAEDVLFELETLFSGLECDGRKVIRDIYRKEDIYSGPYLEQAPDMVLVAAEGFNLKATTKGRQLYDNGIFTGKHTQDTAFLLVRGLKDAAVVPDEPWVMDIKGIVEKARGG